MLDGISHREGSCECWELRESAPETRGWHENRNSKCGCTEFVFINGERIGCVNKPTIPDTDVQISNLKMDIVTKESISH